MRAGNESWCSGLECETEGCRGLGARGELDERVRVWKRTEIGLSETDAEGVGVCMADADADADGDMDGEPDGTGCGCWSRWVWLDGGDIDGARPRWGEHSGTAGSGEDGYARGGDVLGMDEGAHVDA